MVLKSGLKNAVFSVKFELNLVVILRDKHRHFLLMTCKMDSLMALDLKKMLAQHQLSLVIKRYVQAIFRQEQLFPI